MNKFEQSILQRVAKNTLIRWLNLYFDSSFLFNDYKAKLTSQNWRAAAGLIMPANKTQKIDFKIIQ